MQRRDFLLCKTDRGAQVYELACQQLYLRYLDTRRPGSPAAAPGDYWLGEPDPHLTTPSTRELFDGLRHDLAGVDLLRVVGTEWLADADLRREVEALAAGLRAGGGRVEFIADATSATGSAGPA